MGRKRNVDGEAKEESFNAYNTVLDGNNEEHVRFLEKYQILFPEELFA